MIFVVLVVICFQHVGCITFSTLSFFSKGAGKVIKKREREREREKEKERGRERKRKRKIKRKKRRKKEKEQVCSGKKCCNCSYSGFWYLLVRTLLEHYGAYQNPIDPTQTLCFSLSLPRACVGL